MPLSFKLVLLAEQKYNPSITTLGEYGAEDKAN
jgi:hypothetical protein